MDLNKLKVFYYVAKYGSIKSASSHLKAASSNISLSIQSLEKELSEKLFIRQYRGMEMTESGYFLFQSAKRIFDEVSFISDNFEKVSQKKKEICISTTWGISSSDWMIKNLKNIYDHDSDIKVKFVDFDLKDIYENSPDVLIAPYIYNQDNLVQEKVKSFCFKMFAGNEYIKKKGVPKCIDDLDQHVLISFTSEIRNPFTGVDALLQLGRGNNNPRHINLEANSSVALTKLVKNNVGIAVLSTESVNSTEMVPILSENEIIEDIYFSYDKRNKNSKNIDFLKRNIQRAQ